MSRPRYYWYGYVEKLIRRYPNQLLQDGAAQSIIAYLAIGKALEELQKYPDGQERYRLINVLLIKNRYTLEGAAYHLHISDRTAKKWKSDFIYTVARHMQLL